MKSVTETKYFLQFYFSSLLYCCCTWCMFMCTFPLVAVERNNLMRLSQSIPFTPVPPRGKNSTLQGENPSRKLDAGSCRMRKYQDGTSQICFQYCLCFFSSPYICSWVSNSCRLIVKQISVLVCVVHFDFSIVTNLSLHICATKLSAINTAWQKQSLLKQ